MALANRLSMRVVIEQRQGTQDSYGQPSTAWQAVATVWAEMKNVSGREYFAALAHQAELKTEVVVRTRAGVTEGMRLNYKGRLYNIEAVLPQARAHEMLLICSSGVTDG